MSTVNYPVRIILPNVRLSYVNVFTPKLWDDMQKPKYEAIFIIHKEKNAKALFNIKSAIDNIAQQNNLNKSKLLESVLKDGDKEEDFEKGLVKEYANCFTIKAIQNTTKKDGSPSSITVLDVDDTVITDHSSIYPGCFVTAEIDLKYYSIQKQISKYLIKVKKKSDGVRIHNYDELLDEPFDADLFSDDILI